MSTCPQAWHGGLGLGLLVECKYQAKHRGKHRNEAGDLEWSGKLSDAEMARAEELRGKKAKMDVHVYHKVTGPYGTMVFYEGGNLSGHLTLNPASYKAMLGMLDTYSPEEVRVRLIPVPAQYDVATFAVTEETRR